MFKSARLLDFPLPTLVADKGQAPPPVVPARKDPTLHRVEDVFIHDREAPEDWTRDLRSWSPQSDEHGFLSLVWEPGDPWIPAQRWALYEMLHPRNVDIDILEELEGPHPRSEGHMCTASARVPKQYQCLCRRKLETWRGGPCIMITLTQWNLFRRTGYYGVPFWVIQGSQGGHQFQFGEHEQKLLRLRGLPSEAPRPGMLEYAPYDSRVAKKVQRHNKLVLMGKTLGEFKKMMGKDYDAYRETLARELRTEVVEHLETQMQEAAELFIRAADKGEMDDQRRTTIDYDRLSEQATAHFIETGQVLHHTQVK
jgi:hypothetical protein